MVSAISFWEIAMLIGETAPHTRAWLAGGAPSPRVLEQGVREAP